MSTSPRPRPPSPSQSSSVRALSVRGSRPLLPPLSTVITVPPWAKDEPPSPKEPLDVQHGPTPESRASDVASFQSTIDGAPSRWWAFTLPRPNKETNPSEYLLETKPKPTTFRSSKSWLPSSTSAFRDSSTFSRRLGEKPNTNENGGDQPARQPWNRTIQMPSPIAPFTSAHNPTPGWETPWTARPDAQGPNRNLETGNSYIFENAAESSENNSHEDQKSWTARKKRFRIFLLTNTYVPLLFRVINISFTSAALGISVRIRRRESENGIMGAVGSSPTLIIIFAPLTLVHVMIAIYLEYFGRPLGLWRTSGKLAHTLSEVLFICAWSAALSLSFENFFTSLIPCASAEHTAWYNQLPRPNSNLPIFEGSIGDMICDDQLSLICLVGVGLVMYCINLIISLYRIFEKVKALPAASRLGVIQT
ncbi:hypothetical protein E1B28_001183 [Marasmius oreades]|uniref:Uncharacterized protein n=1 Tax=Marasmius oreades TaxID=181124 RepID=A0A9P7V2V8_9AGAR|nr:uncharacterized protein E1B28_001183 [Marasmius oreades]KAG7099325.1 hypothetical protein E1B28_001183 [Marasmius oreades]